MLKRAGCVFLIDDDASMRDSVAFMLREAGYLVYVFFSGADFQLRAQLTHPAVILLDMHMPDTTGIELQTWLLGQGCTIPIVFISGQSHAEQIIQGFKSGAVDFLLKPFGLDALLQAVSRALELDHQRHQTVEVHQDVIRRYGLLTPKERLVLACLADGLQNIEIAEKYGTSPRTVKSQKASVMAKMQAASLQALARMYYEHQLHHIA